jgi:hypothetical protein
MGEHIMTTETFLLRFLRRNGLPETITIDGSEANAAAIRTYNEEYGTAITIRQVKYLHNVVEQDHRAVKRVTRPRLGFKSFDAAQGIVKWLGMILSPGNSRHFPDAISADPTLRPPALSLLFRPNSRSGFASLRGTPTRTADAVAVGSVGPWDHTSTKSAGHARGM